MNTIKTTLLTKDMLEPIGDKVWSVSNYPIIWDDCYVLICPEDESDWMYFFTYCAETKIVESEYVVNRNEMRNSYIILDPTINWHRDLIEIRLLEEL